MKALHSHPTVGGGKRTVRYTYFDLPLPAKIWIYHLTQWYENDLDTFPEFVELVTTTYRPSHFNLLVAYELNTMPWSTGEVMMDKHKYLSQKMNMPALLAPKVIQSPSKAQLPPENHRVIPKYQQGMTWEDWAENLPEIIEL